MSLWNMKAGASRWFMPMGVCLYTQLHIGIIECQTLRVTEFHPPFMSHKALLQNEFYKVFLKYSSEVYIQVQLSPGSRSDSILYINVVISEGNCESSTLYTAVFIVIVQVCPSFHQIFCWELLIYAPRANWF